MNQHSQEKGQRRQKEYVFFFAAGIPEPLLAPALFPR